MNIMPSVTENVTLSTPFRQFCFVFVLFFTGKNCKTTKSEVGNVHPDGFQSSPNHPVVNIPQKSRFVDVLFFFCFFVSGVN